MSIVDKVSVFCPHFGGSFQSNVANLVTHTLPIHVGHYDQLVGPT